MDISRSQKNKVTSQENWAGNREDCHRWAEVAFWLVAQEGRAGGTGAAGGNGAAGGTGDQDSCSQDSPEILQRVLGLEVEEGKWMPVQRDLGCWDTEGCRETKVETKV